MLGRGRQARKEAAGGMCLECRGARLLEQGARTGRAAPGLGEARSPARRRQAAHASLSTSEGPLPGPRFDRNSPKEPTQRAGAGRPRLSHAADTHASLGPQETSPRNGVGAHHPNISVQAHLYL